MSISKQSKWGLALALLVCGLAVAHADEDGPFQLVPRGVEVTEVVRRSPAHRAGLEVGDVIVEINGMKILSETAL
jgi:S1-C subfamily serine protease